MTISQLSTAQNIGIDANLTLKYSNDPVEVKLQVDYDTIDGVIRTNPLSWYKKVKFEFYDSIYTVDESEISSIEFYEPDSSKRTILSEKEAGYQYPNENLVELLHDGKIKWFVDWKPGRSRIMSQDQLKQSISNDLAEGVFITSTVILGGVVGGILVVSALESIKDDNINIETYSYEKSSYYLIKEKEGVKSYSTYEPGLGNTYHKRFYNLDYMMGDRPDLELRVKNIRNEMQFLRLLKDYDLEPEEIIERQLEKSNSNQIDELRKKENFQLIPYLRSGDFREGDLVLYESKSGEILGRVIKPKGSSFLEISYYNEKGNKFNAIVKVSDVKLISFKE